MLCLVDSSHRQDCFYDQLSFTAFDHLGAYYARMLVRGSKALKAVVPGVGDTCGDIFLLSCAVLRDVASSRLEICNCRLKSVCVSEGLHHLFFSDLVAASMYGIVHI